MVRNLPLATSTWDEAESAALERVIASGQYSMGKEVFQFESEFAHFFGTNHCVMVNSGSSANLLAVASLFFLKDNPLKRGDEVIVPAVSWSTTYFPLQQYGLKLVFVDVDEDTFNLDLNQLAEAITSKTRLIFAVNLLGNPLDFASLQDIVHGKNIYLLEDNCESMGAKFNDKYAGTFGIAGTFSSFFSHHISTMEGGMIVTDNEELHHILLSLRAHGWTRNLPAKNLVCTKSDDPFVESYRFVLPGYNVRPLELSGALGREQLKKLPAIVAGRRQNAAIFEDLFGDHPQITIQTDTGHSSWFGFAMVLLDDELSRNVVLDALNKNGIETRPVVAGNFTRNPAIKYFEYSIHQDLTNANRIHDRGFFVGNHHFDISEQLGRLPAILDSV